MSDTYVVEDVDIDPDEITNAGEPTEDQPEETKRFAAAYAVTKTASRSVRRNVANGAKGFGRSVKKGFKATSKVAKDALPIISVALGYTLILWLVTVSIAYLAIAAAAHPLIGILGTIAMILWVGRNLSAIIQRMALAGMVRA
jgi:hypothetical protein